MAKLDQLPNAPLSGWVAGKPDARDFSLSSRTPLGLQVLQAVDRRLKSLRMPRSHTLNLSSFGPVQNQGNLNACCAFAGVSLMEYRLRQDRELKSIECSPGFLYKVTRDLLKKGGQAGTDGNVPTDSRTTMKAMTLVGVAPEDVFPTRQDDVSLEPDLLTYAVASNYKAKAYWRVDVGGTGGEALLQEVKRLLLADLPLMFTVHFLVKTSLQDFAKQTARQAPLPVPNQTEIAALKTRRAIEGRLMPQGTEALAGAAVAPAPSDPQARAQQTLIELQKVLNVKPPAPASAGRTARRTTKPAPPIDTFVGHALVACGFDDDKQCLLVRNSWSDDWAPIKGKGMEGYGLLPYEYVTKGLTEDWWFISDVSSVDSSIFSTMPAVAGAGG